MYLCTHPAHARSLSEYQSCQARPRSGTAQCDGRHFGGARGERERAQRLCRRCSLRRQVSHKQHLAAAAQGVLQDLRQARTAPKASALVADQARAAERGCMRSQYQVAVPRLVKTCGRHSAASAAAPLRRPRPRRARRRDPRRPARACVSRELRKGMCAALRCSERLIAPASRSACPAASLRATRSEPARAPPSVKTPRHAWRPGSLPLASLGLMSGHPLRTTQGQGRRATLFLCMHIAGGHASLQPK